MSLSQTEMGPRDSTATEQWLPIAGAALGLGLFADGLFNGAALGVNFALWVTALIGAFVLVARRGGRPIGRLPASLMTVAFGLALMVAWRAAPELQTGLLIGTVTALLLAFVLDDDTRAHRASVTLLVGSLVTGIWSATSGVFQVLRSIPLRSLLDHDNGEQTRALGRALLIAAPLVLVFGGLFMAADAVFQSWVTSSLDLDAAMIGRHLGWWGGGTLVAAGSLWCGLGPQQAAVVGPVLSEERRLRSIETGIVLGSLAALFGLFVLIQMRYLFGGAEHVLASTGVTYADYARRGFFELVAVAVLLLPVLLAVDWARARSGRSLTTYRVFGVVLVLLLMVVMASALQRLRIYIDVFGLTALRFYATALLAWLATVFAWLLWSLLRERREQFVAGAILTALVALVIVVAVNPHGTIAATNLSNAEAGRDFDVAHALGLSADATPTLLAGIEALDDDDACEVATVLGARWEEADGDLRGWNWGRASASEAVAGSGGRLAAACD